MELNKNKQLKAILSSYGGINNAMKENRQLVKGAPAGYNLMADCLDQLNYLGNNYAVTSGDMAEALKRCGSVAKSSGVSMNHVMSYAMGINESVQDASKVKLLA